MYLGIDQSLLSTGVAVITGEQKVVYVGRITPGKLTGTARLAVIRNAIRQIISDGEAFNFAALEGYSMESVNRSFDLGELGGMVRMLLYDSNIPFVIVPPKSLKLFVTSDGAATKEGMYHATLKKWGIDLPQNDECDAYGLAQVARSFFLNAGTTRAELEVLKKLRNVEKKISLIASAPRSLSI